MWFLLFAFGKGGGRGSVGGIGGKHEGIRANCVHFCDGRRRENSNWLKSGNICYSNRLKSSRRSKRFCDFTVGRDGRVCSHPFVMILGNSQINSINLNSSQNKRGETFRKWQKNLISDAFNGSAEFGGGLLLGRVKFLYGHMLPWLESEARSLVSVVLDTSCLYHEFLSQSQ